MCMVKTKNMFLPFIVFSSCTPSLSCWSNVIVLHHACFQAGVESTYTGQRAIEDKGRSYSMLLIRRTFKPTLGVFIKG